MRAVATTIAAAAAVVTLVVVVGQRMMAGGVRCVMTGVVTLVMNVTLMVPRVVC